MAIDLKDRAILWQTNQPRRLKDERRRGMPSYFGEIKPSNDPTSSVSRFATQFNDARIDKARDSRRYRLPSHWGETNLLYRNVSGWLADSSVIQNRKVINRHKYTRTRAQAHFMLISIYKVGTSDNLSPKWTSALGATIEGNCG